MMRYIVFDLDGVLADCSHRLKYIQQTPKDYDKFYSTEEILKDEPIPAGENMLNAFYRYGKGQIVFLTARNERCRKATETWIADNLGFHHFPIFMRPENDWRPAHIVKEDLIKKYIGFDNILLAFDDDPEVCEMYSRNRISCFTPSAN